MTSGSTGFVNFGAPQINPILQLRARGTPDKKYIFVLNPWGNEVAVLDWKHLTPIATIKVGLDPSSIGQTRKGTYVMVSNWSPDTVGGSRRTRRRRCR